MSTTSRLRFRQPARQLNFVNVLPLEPNSGIAGGVTAIRGDAIQQVEMNMQALVTWADRGGAVLSTGAVPVPAASVDVGQAAMLVPEYGRSVVSTQQEGIQRMARQIVGLMEEPW